MNLPYTIEYQDWHTPATDYTEEEAGSARVKRGRYSKGHYNMWGIDDNLFFKVKRPIPVTQLQIKDNGRWKTRMVDDPPLRLCHYSFC